MRIWINDEETMPQRYLGNSWRNDGQSSKTVRIFLLKKYKDSHWAKEQHDLTYLKELLYHYPENIVRLHHMVNYIF